MTRPLASQKQRQQEEKWGVTGEEFVRALRRWIALTSIQIGEDSTP